MKSPKKTLRKFGGPFRKLLGAPSKKKKSSALPKSVDVSSSSRQKGGKSSDNDTVSLLQGPAIVMADSSEAKDTNYETEAPNDVPY